MHTSKNLLTDLKQYLITDHENSGEHRIGAKDIEAAMALVLPWSTVDLNIKTTQKPNIYLVIDKETDFKYIVEQINTDTKDH